MFLDIPKKQQVAILCIKINEIDISKDFSKKDKAQMMDFYRKKLKKIEPNKKF